MAIEKRNFHCIEEKPRRRTFLIGAGVTVLSLGIGIGLQKPRVRIASLPQPDIRERLNLDEAFGNAQGDTRIQSLWQEYAAVPIFHENTRALFGADTDKSGLPEFHTDEAVSALKSAQPFVQDVSGIVTDIRTGRRTVTAESISQIKSSTLEWISETREPITLIISAHGVRNAAGTIDTISLGTARDRSGASVSTTLHPRELAEAYARRYRSMRARLQARGNPDVLAFINCGAGDLAADFVASLAERELAQEPRRFISSFKPTGPLTFSAGTGEEITFINQFLVRMAEFRSVGELQPYMEFVGSNTQHSNPMLRVPDPDTGETVIIGTRTLDTRLG